MRTGVCRGLAVIVIASVVGLLCSTGTSLASPRFPASGDSNGTLIVLEPSTGAPWQSLDPATGTGTAGVPTYLDAIFGDLFEQGPGNKPIPDLALGYTFSDGGKTVTIKLRSGVTFTDGTPFNSAAVKFNIDRDLSKSSADACACSENFPIASITTPNPLTVVLHLTKPDGAIIEAFYGEAPNWIGSPTAITKMGAKNFGAKPIGAGPFMVKSNEVGSTLKLIRNPHYWARGKPYLSGLTFELVGSDESAYAALQTGAAQSYQRFASYNLLPQVRKNFTVTAVPATDPAAVQLNTKSAPFNNRLAREALYYATDAAAINKAITLGTGTVTESMTGPDGLFYEPTVPGYRGYDLAKAKAIVKQLGGLKFTLGTFESSSTDDIITALKSEWSQAGIDATLNPQNFDAMVDGFNSGNWQASLQLIGGVDPALGYGLSFRYESGAPISGISDPALDKLINAGLGTLNQSKRAAIYRQAFHLIAEKAYSPFLFTLPAYNISARSVHGTGLTSTEPEVLWEDVTLR